MNKIDVNCFLGHWPFRKLYKNTYDDLLKVHADNNILYGYLSSLNSIFYNDPFEGEEELHEIIKNTGYKHILTVNPTLPGFMDDVERGIKLFKIWGVRVYPGYHGYQLDNSKLQKLCNLLDEAKLPLFLTTRMEDERLNYLFQPPSLTCDDIIKFLMKNPKLKTLLLSVRYGELQSLKEIINSSENIFFDTSGLKESLFVIEKLLKVFVPEKIIYGSMHPLFCLKSTMLLVEKAEIDESIKEKIFISNINQLLK